MARFSKILKDGLFLGAFLVLASMIMAKLDLNEEVRLGGPFFAIDGDTLAAGAERLRLLDLDAPEADQQCRDGNGRDWPCGDAARSELSKLASGREASCSGGKRDRYDRILVRCRANDVDINGELVRRGMAVSAGGYGSEEAMAKADRRGIWAGPFDTPRRWRAQKGMMDDDAADWRLLSWLKGIMGW